MTEQAQQPAQTQEWTREKIITLLETNDKAVGRALVLLLNNQTADEQASEVVRHNNGMGFRPCDAFMGTKLAQFFQARGFLSEKQLAWARKTNAAGKMRIACYANQILRQMKVNAQQAAQKEQAE